MIRYLFKFYSRFHKYHYVFLNSLDHVHRKSTNYKNTLESFPFISIIFLINCKWKLEMLPTSFCFRFGLIQECIIRSLDSSLLLCSSYILFVLSLLSFHLCLYLFLSYLFVTFSHYIFLPRDFKWFFCRFASFLAIQRWQSVAISCQDADFFLAVLYICI